MNKKNKDLEDIFKQTYTTNINSATTGDLTSNSGSITTGTITTDNLIYSPIQYGSYQKSDKEKVKNIMIDFLEWVLDKNEPENKDLFSLYWGIKRLDVKNV